MKSLDAQGGESVQKTAISLISNKMEFDKCPRI